MTCVQGISKTIAGHLHHSMGGGRRRTSTESATKSLVYRSPHSQDVWLPATTTHCHDLEICTIETRKLEACRSSRVAWPLSEQQATKPRNHGSRQTQNIKHPAERGTEHEKTRGLSNGEKTIQVTLGKRHRRPHTLRSTSCFKLEIICSTKQHILVDRSGVFLSTLLGAPSLQARSSLK